MTRWATLLVRKPLGKVLAAPNGDYALRRTVVSRPGRRTERPTLGAFFFTSLDVFSKFYFSATIISDSKTYGTIGAVFGIMTWLIAIGAVPISGAVTGVAWEEWRNQQTRGALSRLGGSGPTRSPPPASSPADPACQWADAGTSHVL